MKKRHAPLDWWARQGVAPKEMTSARHYVMNPLVAQISLLDRGSKRSLLDCGSEYSLLDRGFEDRCLIARLMPAA
jgi:hypothetical protein